MPTVEELYRNYGILADATETAGQHKDAYQVILDGVKGGAKEKRLAAQFIPKFFKHFPELADSAINAQLDLCEDEDVSVRAGTGNFYPVMNYSVNVVAAQIGFSPVLLKSKKNIFFFFRNAP
uniref:Apoptosis inhibitor 5 n=1 Tax=Pavo cristatus TaxID=9049 RepID=A0A8C9EP33_PAVCR